MTIPILTLDPDWEITENYEFITKEVRLGDNYKQSLNPSTVSLQKTWNVKKSGLTRNQVNDLIAELKLYSGVVPFSWTPGQGVTADTYLCDEWRVNPIGGGNVGGAGASTYWTIDATFRQDPKSACLEYESDMPTTEIQSVLSGMKSYLLEYTNNRGATSKPHLITSDTINSVLRYFLKYGFNSPNITKYLKQHYSVSDYQTQARFLLGCVLARAATGDITWWNSLGLHVRSAIALYHRLSLTGSSALPTTYYNAFENIRECGDTTQANKNYYGKTTTVTFTSGTAVIPSGGSTDGERLSRVFRVYKTTGKLAAPTVYAPLLDLQKDNTDELNVDYWVSNYELRGQNLRLNSRSFGEDQGAATTTSETAGTIQLSTNFSGSAIVVYTAYKSAVEIAAPNRFCSYPIRRNVITNESETFISSLFDAHEAATQQLNILGSVDFIVNYFNSINATLTQVFGSSGDGANDPFFFRRETGFVNIPLPYSGQSYYLENASTPTQPSRLNTPNSFAVQVNNSIQVTTPSRPYNAFAKWGLKNEGVDFRIAPESRFNIEYFSYKNRNDRRLLRVFVNVENLFDNDSQTKDEYETWVVADSIIKNNVPNDPGFFGGQCDNVQYRITFSVFNYLSVLNCIVDESPAVGYGSVLVRGPIQEFRLAVPGTTSGGCPGFRELQVFARATSGAEPSWITIASSYGINIFVSWSIVSIVREDGLPDTCGDPPQPPQESRAVLNNISLSYLDFKKWNQNKLIWYPGFNGHNYIDAQLTPQLPNIGALRATFTGASATLDQIDNSNVIITYANVLETINGTATYPLVGQVQTRVTTAEDKSKLCGGFVLANLVGSPRRRVRIKYRLTGSPMTFYVSQASSGGWEYTLPVSSDFTIADINFERDLKWSSYNTADNPNKPYDASRPSNVFFFLGDRGDSFIELQWISPNEGNDPESIPKRCRVFGFGLECNDYDITSFGVGNASVTNIDSSKKYTPGIVNKFVQATNNTIEAFIGSPSPSYQSLYYWLSQGNRTNAENVADFLLEAQDDFARRNTDYEGAFTPIFYDKDYKRPEAYLTGYEKFNFNSTTIEDNVDYAGEQYIALERTAKAWFFDPTFEKAGIITMRFLEMLDEFMKKNATNRVPTKITNSTVALTNHDPGCSALVLRAALYANLAGGDTRVTYRVMRKCYNYLMTEYISNIASVNAGSFTNSQASFTFNSVSYRHNYGSWVAEELITFAELLKYRNQINYPPCRTNFT